MPKFRTAACELGFAVFARSSLAMLSALPEMAGAQAAASAQASTVHRAIRIRSLLPVGVEHVFESHPLRVEKEVHVTRGTVAILSDQQFGGALDVARGLVHVRAEKG